MREKASERRQVGAGKMITVEASKLLKTTSKPECGVNSGISLAGAR
jgi:hypothetical protein